MKNDLELSELFAALAHPTRVAILRILLSRFPEGRLFGDIAKDLGVAPSTLKHHLIEMENGGVARREPQGRTTLFRLDANTLTNVAAELSTLCCSIEPQSKPPRAKHDA